jgi:hypothetical protein
MIKKKETKSMYESYPSESYHEAINKLSYNRQQESLGLFADS